MFNNRPISNIEHLRVWGCDAWVHIRNTTKTEPHAWLGMLVGYDK